MSSFSPLQRVLIFVMAALVLLSALFIPNNRSESQRKYGFEKEAYLTSISVQSIPGLSSSSNPLPKLNLLLFALSSFWSLMLLLKALEVQENQTLLKRFFLQKILFNFVSTKAP